MSDALVSFVVPVWDAHVALLPRCLRVIEHEPVAHELVIVDNASATPVTPPRGAQVVRLAERRSVGAARNTGLQHVTTPFVVFADADDELVQGSVARALESLGREPDAVAVLGRSVVDESGNRRRGRTPSNLFIRISRQAPALAAWMWLAAFQASITNTVLRTSTVRDAGGFADGNLAEDWHLAARLARRGRMLVIDDPVRVYHRHDATLRSTEPRLHDPDAARRAVCDDCRHDGAASWAQRIVATAFARPIARKIVQRIDPLRAKS